MSVGFRKSLFGFNSSDVLNYIEKTYKEFTKKESALNQKLEDVSHELALSNENCEKLSAEKQELTQKIEEFNAKYDEIERLSENIGKLYLVAQTNSRVIMESSEENAKAAEKEIEQNLSSIDEAHKSLQDLRLSITKTSENFVKEVDRLIGSLNTTREQITENKSAIENAKTEFTKVFSSITE